MVPWKGELAPHAELQEGWIQVRGIPPNWCCWKVFDQFSSSFGLLEEVDWQELFRTFYEVVRIRIRYRDFSKVPKKRLFCMNEKLYSLVVVVEDLPIQKTSNTGDDGGDGETGMMVTMMVIMIMTWT